MRLKRRLTTGWIVFLVAVFAFGLWSEVRERHRYHIGMTIGEVRTLLDNPPMHTYGREYLNPPTFEQMTEDEMYLILDEQHGVLLKFNHFEKLIGIQRYNPCGINLIKIVRTFQQIGSVP